jgi:hypothetical protein
MGVRDPKEALISPIHNNILSTCEPLSIANDNNSYLPDSGIRKVVTSSVAILIKVK